MVRTVPTDDAAICILPSGWILLKLMKAGKALYQWRRIQKGLSTASAVLRKE